MPATCDVRGRQVEQREWLGVTGCPAPLRTRLLFCFTSCCFLTLPCPALPLLRSGCILYLRLFPQHGCGKCSAAHLHRHPAVLRWLPHQTGSDSLVSILPCALSMFACDPCVCVCVSTCDPCVCVCVDVCACIVGGSPTEAKGALGWGGGWVWALPYRQVLVLVLHRHFSVVRATCCRYWYWYSVVDFLRCVYVHVRGGEL